jgi:small ligand-binding sensory domain FIST
MEWVSAVSTQVSLEMAIRDIAQQVQKQVPTPDLGFLFVSGSFASEYPRVLPLLKEYLPIPHLIGCSGGGIIGGGRELEDKPAISLLAGSLPTAQITSFHCTAPDLPDLDSPPQSWQELIGVDPEVRPSFVLLVDAFTFPVNDFLQGMDFAYAGCVKVGGLASGGAPYHALFRNEFRSVASADSPEKWLSRSAEHLVPTTGFPQSRTRELGR